LKTNVVLFFAILIISFSFGSAAGTVVEFKEYKVINSPAVCGDKLCKQVDEERSKKGLSTRDVKVCGNEPCKYLDRAESTIPKNIDTPLGKYKFGIPLHQITCNEELKLVLKASNNYPACVKSENAIRLIASGWALDIELQKQIIAESEEKYTSKIALASYSTDDLLSASFDKVYDQDFVVFEGIGWHRLHNVEITISGEQEIIDSVRSQTTDRGRLWMHWPIPESLPAGQYHIHATDGIHSADLSLEVT